MKLRFILTFLLCIGLKLNAQTIQKIGVPYIQNFYKSDYAAGNQNWAIAKDKNGIIYFGNSEGLLSYDGNYWQTHKLPHRLVVRSVATDKTGRIYTGGFGELGYWEYDERAILNYHSLTNLVKDKSTLNNEVWKIYVDGNRVIFQTFANIFIYQNNKIEIIKGNGSFLFLLKAGKRFFVETPGSGVYELIGNKLSFLPVLNKKEVSNILSILPFGKDSYLIGTAKNGLFLYNGKTVTKWVNQGDGFLSTYQLNNGVKIFDKYFAYGTILNGVIILDENGQIVQHINKGNGLQNNTVLSLFTDENQNLWVGLDNGIDRVDTSSPLYFFFDKNGIFGTVYSSIIFGDRIYLGTNQGLYQSDWDNKDNKSPHLDFKIIPNSQGQVWDLSVHQGNLICGHNNGTYLVNDDKIEKISSVSGGWTIKGLGKDADKLIQGTYTGLVIYQKTNGSYAFSNKVIGFNQPSRYIEEDDKGNFWICHPYKGLFKVKLSDDYKTAKSVKQYDKSSGLSSDYGISVFKLNGKIVFSSDAGFYVYDDISDKFYPYNQLNSKLGSFKSSNKIIKATDQKFWFIDHGKVALANFPKPGILNIDSNMFKILNGRMVQDYENISKIDENLFLISVDDGFVIYNKQNFVKNKLNLPSVFIGRIENISTDGYLITESGSLAKNIAIRFSKNSLRINYSLPYYGQGKIKYQYFLDGFTKKWSTWSVLCQKDFTNLPYGDYTFKVRALVNEGKVSNVSEFNFTVLAPFYATVWAYIVYFVLFVLAIYFIRIWYFKKLTKHQKALETRLKNEQNERLREEAIANQQKLATLKNQQLQTELNNKAREATNSAMNIVYKNELLQKIKDEILNLKDKEGKKIAEDQLKRIQKIIDESLNDERDWNLFETSFNETHESFFKKLKVEHPDLVPNDLKLCAYLRMNMSSKEMASLLNISVRGVEIRRYRLRKKLNIAHDKNLNEFLIEL
ncbi:transcriptional regulator [Pedobacter sp. SD-b]|uniref:Transcriptional regulator n=1 Tax=Pedobacter segetis TaxID=2793069 RepID=A0ABS1BK79_9SPHI|nr:two-component regulator propeller domain-containing protein [Pedobacter segetis]MBK0383300.1 transcriptional regulator [Pedobacter segetis]